MYTGPSVEHYRCYKVYIYKRIAEHISDTFELFPEKTTIPIIYSDDVTTDVPTDLISALKNKAPDAPFAPLGTEKLDALIKLADILQGQTTGKNNLDTTKTQTKILEQTKNMIQPPPKVEPQSVTVPEYLTHQTRCKA